MQIGAQLEDVADAFRWTVDELPTELERAVEAHSQEQGGSSGALDLLLDRIVVQGNSQGGFLTLALALGALPTLHITDQAAHTYLARVRGANPIYAPVVPSDTVKTRADAPYPTDVQLFTPAHDALMASFADTQADVCIDTHFERAQSTPGWARNLLYPWLCQTRSNTAAALYGPDETVQAAWLARTNLRTHIQTHAQEIRRVVGSALAAGTGADAGDTGAAAEARLHLFLVHGDKDRFVPFSGSRDLVPVLRDAGFRVRFASVPGADHVFDNDPDVHLTDVYNWMRSITWPDAA